MQHLPWPSVRSTGSSYLLSAVRVCSATSTQPKSLWSAYKYIDRLAPKSQVQSRGALLTIGASSLHPCVAKRIRLRLAPSESLGKPSKETTAVQAAPGTADGPGDAPREAPKGAATLAFESRRHFAQELIPRPYHLAPGVLLCSAECNPVTAAGIQAAERGAAASIRGQDRRAPQGETSLLKSRSIVPGGIGG
ncbi:hypothetical protein TrVFT333_005296 [Trichoderma virens FT-333]|nr:hypothetical protein TrVFT333_005296 [Trichoderma virens FT-333]